MALRSSVGIALAIGGPLAIASTGTAQDAGARVRWERPAPGTLESGAIGVPEWVVFGTAATIVLAAIAMLVSAARRSRGRGGRS